MSTSRADALLQDLVSANLKDPARSIAQCDSLIAFYTAQHLICNLSRTTSLKATFHAYTGDLVSANENLISAVKTFEEGKCDDLTEMIIRYAKGYIRVKMNEPESADSILLEAITDFCPEWPEKGLLLKLYLNLQFVGWELPQIKEYLDTATHLAKTHHLPSFEIRLLINLGTQFAYRESFETAKKYFVQALKIARQLGDDTNLMTLYNNMAGLSDDNQEMMGYVDSAIVYADKLQNLNMQQALYQNKAYIFYEQGKFKSGYDAFREAFYLKDSMMNIEKYKTIADMREKYEAQKRTNEIQSLKLENLDAELTSLKYKRTRNKYLGGGIMSLGLAAMLGYGLVSIRKSRRIIAKEKERSESLLLNILPAEIADELKTKGYADPRHFDNVSILFSDFKNFTNQAALLTPIELVMELNVCFEAFDRITETYGLEKIKTIGDAYMAACGLPVPVADGVRRTLLAGIEMQKFINERQIIRTQEKAIAFEMRLGVHTGPVVAGIVGVKKFQYDVWGDTVNTASRMETYGVVGQVNISDETYQLAKNDPSFTFTFRNTIEVKGKGQQRMWNVWLA